MRAFGSILFLLTLVMLPASFQDGALQLQCAKAAKSCGDCPPHYCEDKAAAKKAKDKKVRAAISKGLPRRLAQLFYQLENCVGCVETAPDWVTISWEIDVDAMEKIRGSKVKYTKHWQTWSAELEWKLRKQMQEGLIKEVHFMVQGGSRCRCCKPGEYKNFRYRIGQDAKDERKMDKGESVAGYNTDFEYYKPYGKKLKDPENIPKDLNEVPEGLKSPDSIKMPKLRMGPAERSITQPCPKCRKEAENYNDAVHAINDLRRPLAKARQVAGFYSKVVAYAWRTYSATQYIADPDVRAKKESEALDLYRIRQEQWDDAKAELKDLQEKDQKLRASLKPLFAALLACEETCKVPEPKIEHKVGDDFEIELEDTISVTGKNAFDAGEVEVLISTPNDYRPTPTTSQPQTPTLPKPEPTTAQPEPETVVSKPPVVAEPPKPKPLSVSHSGVISFEHAVGESPCPQNAGTVYFSANDGRRIEVQSVSVSGSIQPKLNISKFSDRVEAIFNCSSPENGRFTGTITVVVRDPKTGETQTVNIPGSGGVSGSI